MTAIIKKGGEPPFFCGLNPWWSDVTSRVEIFQADSKYDNCINKTRTSFAGGHKARPFFVCPPWVKPYGEGMR
jgi:hypothetical protein